ncbi:MAG: ATP-binding protein [Candidatus Pacebacteria bacterium]|jgi:PAS domain S-box-containing protein|nr:ATP-binding protein [Candidatus Paceibacterota bacterium]
MKLRTKTILFFGISFFVTAVIVASYGQYVIGDTFKKQTTNDVRIFAEQSEGAYYTFLGKMKGRVLDWSADPLLQDIAENILNTKEGTSDRTRATKAFADYVTEKKMPYDKTVLFADILDKNGLVVASTDPTRIGRDEAEEERQHKISYFSQTINSSFGEAFVKSVVFEEDESSEPMAHATTRIFTQSSSGEFAPLDAVLMIHFLSIDEIADVLSGEAQLKAGARTGRALLSSYDTSEIYLVNSDHLMVTPTRYVKDVKTRQKVDTFPVRKCFEDIEEVTTEYEDYRGEQVLGASMCLPDEGLVLLVEVNKDEIFAPFTALMYESTVAGTLLLLGGMLVIVFFVRPPLRRVNEIIAALERVMNGNFDVKVKVSTNDETGRLATMFNTMVDAIRNNQKDLEESRRLVEEKATLLERDLGEHEKQEKFLEESKRATLNLLEDSWKAKEKLEEEGNKLQTIITSIGDALVLIDLDYKIILVNTKALEVLGMAREELLSKDLRDIMKLYKKKQYVEPKDWPTEEMFRTKEAITSTLEDNLYILTKGRSTQLPVTVSIAPINGRFAGAVIVIRDVTSDRVLDEAKSSFISVASHQLRTPLTSIRWYSEMLLSEDAGTLNDSQKDFMKEIHGGAERLYQTVDLLLGISRVENGKVKMNRSLIDLSSFTGDITKELNSQINDKKLTLAVDPSEAVPVAVWLDPLILRQVILNLVSNAIRYTPENGTIKITWRIGDGGKEVIYSVSDSGIGIPAHQKNRIFSKFFRAENARMQVPDGSGLGLALVKDLVEAWGGRVWFESEEGKGSTFFFTVPVTVTTTV